eukprot:TRINITY_DN61436_c0_g1_i1.p1 TRINITY_DN61436_c0_g1~~TRINITY_DN61436_c0_g1_i1.p1  ORF type:complete len:398 (-),score=47.51 TRINITY_DN61436_c0_g1_i1:67-1260(-)
MEKVQTLVVGAGVVGLAVARALSRRGREVFVVECAGVIGNGTSSRNSEVVHAGIYYPAGSLKAKHCVRGKNLLFDYCQERGIRHNICGKLIVATNEAQKQELAKITAHAERNGVHLEPLTADEARAMEPEVFCVAALHSPRTAIVDSHGLMESLLADAEDAGAMLALKTKVLPGGRLLPGGGVSVKAESLDSGETFELRAQEVINCAGLAAPRVAKALGIQGEDVPTPHFCRGTYCILQGAGRPFSRLIYPTPEKNTSGLGTHATIDLNGSIRFGPDVEWLPDSLPNGRALDDAVYDEVAQAEAYAVDNSRGDSFYKAIRQYWPGLPDKSLVADYTGIRPKLSAPGQPAADFRFEEHRSSVGGPVSVLNLYGIESPGLTSSLSLAEEACERLALYPE